MKSRKSKIEKPFMPNTIYHKENPYANVNSSKKTSIFKKRTQNRGSKSK